MLMWMPAPAYGCSADKVFDDEVAALGSAAGLTGADHNVDGAQCEY